MQKTPRVYSTLFSTVHDEPAPYGSLNAHYSVFRSVVHYDPTGALFDWDQTLALHHMAVIWDADHDTRIISVMEQLAVHQCLSPIVFIGESRGRVVILLCREFFKGRDKLSQLAYYHRVQEIVKNPLHGDPWTVVFGEYASPAKRDAWELDNAHDIIPGANNTDTLAYLDSITTIWRLGGRDFEKGDSLTAHSSPPLSWRTHWPKSDDLAGNY